MAQPKQHGIFRGSSGTREREHREVYEEGVEVAVLINFRHCRLGSSDETKRDENLTDEIFFTRKFPDLRYKCHGTQTAEVTGILTARPCTPFRDSR